MQKSYCVSAFQIPCPLLRPHYRYDGDYYGGDVRCHYPTQTHQRRHLFGVLVGALEASLIGGYPWIDCGDGQDCGYALLKGSANERMGSPSNVFCARLTDSWRQTAVFALVGVMRALKKLSVDFERHDDLYRCAIAVLVDKHLREGT